VKQRSLEGVIARLVSGVLLALGLFAVLRGDLSVPHSMLLSARPGEVITGSARAIDGDSPVVGGREIRIEGIDAPEMRQTCQRGGEEWRCGLDAARRLRTIIDAGTVACTTRGTDRFGRTLAVCRDRERADIGARLVGEGYAVSFGLGYLLEETRARLGGRGLWGSTFERPAEWRARRSDMGL
jgi:endonuclease YncB( thermonuclease family)